LETGGERKNFYLWVGLDELKLFKRKKAFGGKRGTRGGFFDLFWGRGNYFFKGW